ncbi:MAG: hypothetical protein Tsb009_13830 [Planctomycetaceae bacterium]
MIGGAIVFAGFLAAERPPGGTLLAIAVIGGAVALLAKREWQDKAFGTLGVNSPVQRYVVLGVTILFMLVTFGSSSPETDDADNNEGEQQQAEVEPKSELPESELPEYEVIDTVDRPATGMHANILIPSYSRKTPVGKQEKTARAIAEKEGCKTVNLYNTKAAHEAMNSAAYRKEHPDAAKGYLGSWGVVPGEYTAADDWDETGNGDG